MQPTGVSAKQDGTTITVSWTLPDPTPSEYIIYYSATGDKGSVTIDSGSDQAVITEQQADRVYIVSMVALSKHLPIVFRQLPLHQVWRLYMQYIYCRHCCYMN